jgi:hypothetical protein
VKVDGTSVGTVGSYTFSGIKSDHTIEAIFGVKTYTITATASTGGTISPSGSVIVNHGTDQAFAISVSDGYVIKDVKVDGLSVGVVSEYKFENVKADHKIEAIIALKTYTIKATAGSNGTINPLGNVVVNYGTDKTFTITPADLYKIADVKVDGTSVGAVASYTFTKVVSDHTIEAEFKEAEYIYTITATAGTGGVITPSGEVKVKRGESPAFIMTPDEGYVIQDVKVDGQSMSTVAKFVFTNVKSDHTISVKFRLFGNPVKQSALLQNYPNPFNPETWLPFQLKEDSEVSIRIYSLKGEIVRELKLGHKSAGMYMDRDKSAYWDGRNESGEKVSSGIYFYTIQAGKFTATRRMVISK